MDDSTKNENHEKLGVLKFHFFNQRALKVIIILVAKKILLFKVNKYRSSKIRFFRFFLWVSKEAYSRDLTFSLCCQKKQNNEVTFFLKLVSDISLRKSTFWIESYETLFNSLFGKSSCHFGDVLHGVGLPLPTLLR